MARQRRVKATFYLPVVDNDGTDLEPLIHEVEDRCFAEFGAWTFVGYFSGAWRLGSGERRLDTCAVYSVVTTSSGIRVVRKILTDFKRRTGQEAIYLEIDRDVDVEFL